MMYNWQLKDWPHFQYDTVDFDPWLMQIAQNEGVLRGIMMVSKDDEKIPSETALLVEEVMKNAAIEGEQLNRTDVQSSIQNQLGMHQPPLHIRDQRAKGMAVGMMSLRSAFAIPMTNQMLFDWHNSVMAPYKTIATGQWRKSKEPMQVVSGRIGKEVVHFQAPPSDQLPSLMDGFIGWYSKTQEEEQAKRIYQAPIVSAVAHLYFESIHPFEDGNGRIGRMISIKALSKGMGYPIIFPLSKAINNRRKDYYNQLQKAQQTMEIKPWIDYFLKTIIEAQEIAIQAIGSEIKKTHFFDKYDKLISARQRKVLLKMLTVEPEGFIGGMNAKKYMSITKVSKATATRDLQQLLDIGALQVEGGGRSTRYQVVL